MISHRRVAALSRLRFQTICILAICPIAHLRGLSQTHGSSEGLFFFFSPADLQLRCVPSVILPNGRNAFRCNLSCWFVESCCAELVPRQPLSGSVMSASTTQLEEMKKAHCSNWLDATFRWHASMRFILWQFNNCVIWLQNSFFDLKNQIWSLTETEDVIIHHEKHVK